MATQPYPLESQQWVISPFPNASARDCLEQYRIKPDDLNQMTREQIQALPTPTEAVKAHLHSIDKKFNYWMKIYQEWVHDDATRYPKGVNAVWDPTGYDPERSDAHLIKQHSEWRNTLRQFSECGRLVNGLTSCLELEIDAQSFCVSMCGVDKFAKTLVGGILERSVHPLVNTTIGVFDIDSYAYPEVLGSLLYLFRSVDFPSKRPEDWKRHLGALYPAAEFMPERTRKAFRLDEFIYD